MDYRQFTFRLINAGLDLRDTPDKVMEGKWTRLTNVRSTQEGSISSREGRGAFLSLGTVPIHSLKRLDESTVIIGVGNLLFYNGFVYGGIFDPEIGFSGNRVSIVPSRPAKGSDVWAYIGDSAIMRKVHSDGSIFQWGISPPSIAATATTNGTGQLDTAVAASVAYNWRYTYYSTRTGAESNPSPISASSLSGSGFSALVRGAGSTDPQVDVLRFYRQGGTLTTTWRLEVEVLNDVSGGDVEYTSTIPDSQIATGTPIPTTKDRPFTSINADGTAAQGRPMPYLAGPFLGKYILGCGDELRPGYVYWTNTEDPDSAAASNNVQVTPPSEPLMGIFDYNGQPWVPSRDNLYRMDFSPSSTSAVFFRGLKTPVGKGCVNPNAFAVGPFIYLCAQDGIYQTTGDQPAVSITDDSIRPIFEGRAVDGFEPVNFSVPNTPKLYYGGQELHFLYTDIAGTKQHLFYDVRYQRWQRLTHSAFTVTAAYADENQTTSRFLFGGSDGTLYLRADTVATDAGTPIVSNARTGFIDFDAPQTLKEFGNILLDVDPKGGTITITPYLNNINSPMTPLLVTGNGRQKVALSLGDTYAYSIAFDLSWTAQIGPAPTFTALFPTIYQFDLQWRFDEERIKHWEFPPTGHGLSGWQILRDCYITLRSTSTVMLSTVVDGVPYTYSIPSTSGEKRKVYIPLSPTKGKLFQYKLDASEDFSVYGDDCEMRVKPWNTNLGFQLVSPFRREA